MTPFELYFGFILVTFWLDFGARSAPKFNENLIDFGYEFGSIWPPVWLHFASIWDPFGFHFEVILAPFYLSGGVLGGGAENVTNFPRFHGPQGVLDLRLAAAIPPNPRLGGYASF